MASKIV